MTATAVLFLLFATSLIANLMGLVAAPLVYFLCVLWLISCALSLLTWVFIFIAVAFEANRKRRGR